MNKYLDGYADEDNQKRGANLKLALYRHPDNIEIRTTYAAFLRYPGKDPKESLAVLSPLLDKDEPYPLWLAYEAAKDMGDLEAALAFVERLKPTNGEQISISKIKGDLNLKLGNVDAAIEQFNREIASKVDGERKIIGLFSRAFANLQKGDVSQAAKDAENAAQMCFDLDECDFHACRVEFAEGYSDMCGVDECVFEVCRAFISGIDISPIKRDSEAFGQLCYLFSKYESTESGIEDEDSDEPNFWVAKAAEVLSHPVLSGALSDQLRLEDNFPEALEHHMRYCIWKFRQAAETGRKVHLTGSFYDVTDYKCSKGDLKRIQKILKTHLDEHGHEPVLKPLFVSLYHSTWSPLLWAEKMFKEMFAVAEVLAPTSEKDGIWFDLAYSASSLEKKGTAENAYRRCIELNPKNSSALHNLSLLIEKADLAEAIELQQRAYDKNPKDEVIKKRYDRFKPVIHFKNSMELSLSEPVEFEALTLKDRLYLGAVLVACLSEDQKIIHSVSEINERLAPGHDYVTSILRHLWHSDILVLDPHSNIEALSLSEDGRYLAKLHNVRWLLNVKSKDKMSRAKMLTELIQPELLDTANLDEATELWHEVALEESLEYLQYKRDSVSLSAEVSEKTREYFVDLMQRYSTAQMYNIIWNSVKNAVMYQREKGLPNAHAANLVVSQCKQYGDKAMAEGWDLKPYRRNFDLPQTIISHLLYDRLLGIGEAGFHCRPGSYPILGGAGEREATPLLES
ncbi:MAG: hypothetical protein AB7P49_07355 [Bdellovibrionales bacterium]